MLPALSALTHLDVSKNWPLQQQAHPLLRALPALPALRELDLRSTPIGVKEVRRCRLPLPFPALLLVCQVED